MSSVFSEISPEEHVASNASAFAIRDNYPVSEGHTLVILRREVPSFFEATPEEQQALMALVAEVKQQLDKVLSPDGYNIGINDGAAAGQTIPHLHIHVIPRFINDVDDPAGGVRFVIPEEGNYRRPGFIPSRHDAHRPPASKRLSTGSIHDPFEDHLLPLWGLASEIAILAAFVQPSGVDRLYTQLLDALHRGTNIRVLTGDYLHITQARALRKLLDLELASSANLTEKSIEKSIEKPLISPIEKPLISSLTLPTTGSLKVQIVEMTSLKGIASTFHPKAWIFASGPKGEGGTAYVGSSNLSKAALTDGVEWNLRIDHAQDPIAFKQIRGAFDECWARGHRLDDEWLEGYKDRALLAPQPFPPGEVEDSSIIYTPRDVQKEALEALKRDRENGRRRAIVVMATGLGKTWLAAFDIRNFYEFHAKTQQTEKSAPSKPSSPPRVLFIAHRTELLDQAARTLRHLFPDAVFGWFAGPHRVLDTPFVFASIMKISRDEHLYSIDPKTFDYIVIDEVHHAAARGYRKVIRHLNPAFWLGLTATPERADGDNILGLFDDNLSYRADLPVGIELGHLVPFQYFGIKDTIDYAPIPWRSGRFALTELSKAAQTAARMERLWEALQKHPGQRSLFFCCTIAHATFVSAWLNEKGISSAVVHSGPGSANRGGTIQALSKGKLQAVCSVDLFNEGLDVPKVDRVVMLRPTESNVVFLQQLGRGLRSAPGKKHLTVIDFVGNHKIFLNRVRWLLELSPKQTSLHNFIAEKQPGIFPEGCSVDIELSAIDLLSEMLSGKGCNVLISAYRSLRDSNEHRPTLGAIYRRNFNHKSLKDGWFNFLLREKDLTKKETAVWSIDPAREWLENLDKEAAHKSFKLVTVQAMINAGKFCQGMDTAKLAEESFAIMQRDPSLWLDLEGTKGFEDPNAVSPKEWLTYWTRWPMNHWAAEAPKQKKRGAVGWFNLNEGHFALRFSVDESLQETLTTMTQEVLDYRLAQYRQRGEKP